jgi:serine/threonine protein kinase
MGQGGLPLLMVLTIMKQVVAGLRHLHRLGVLHRDVRSANVLVAAIDPVHVLLADLGVAHLLSAFVHTPEPAATASKMHTLLTGEAASGPLFWLAPEVFAGDTSGTSATTASDVYMVGGLFFELLTAGLPPFFWLVRNVTLFRDRRSSAVLVTVPGLAGPGLPGLAGKSTLEAADVDRVTVPWCVQLEHSAGSEERLRQAQELTGRCLATDPTERPRTEELAAALEDMLSQESIAVQSMGRARGSAQPLPSGSSQGSSVTAYPTTLNSCDRVSLTSLEVCVGLRVGRCAYVAFGGFCEALVLPMSFPPAWCRSWTGCPSWSCLVR